EGAQFRLQQLDLTSDELNDEDHLRNFVAYKCFGVAEFDHFVGDPFAPAIPGYGLLDTLRPKRLGDCEVPLALVHWAASDGIKFTDAWSVRRPLILAPSAGAWSPLVGARRVAEGMAMLLQFQEHLDALVGAAPSQATLAALEVEKHFRFLPSFGL